MSKKNPNTLQKFLVSRKSAWQRFIVVHTIIFAILAIMLAAQPVRADPIYLTQNFESGAADAFEKALTTDTETVVLAVSGGYLAEGMEIGRIIRARGLGTIVPAGANCLSACAEAFLGGVTMQIDGVVAFHMPRVTASMASENAFSQGLAGGTITAIYRFEMGFGFELTKTINRWTTNDRLLAFESAEELLRYKNDDGNIQLPQFYER